MAHNTKIELNSCSLEILAPPQINVSRRNDYFSIHMEGSMGAAPRCSTNLGLHMCLGVHSVTPRVTDALKRQFILFLFLDSLSPRVFFSSG